MAYRAYKAYNLFGGWSAEGVEGVKEGLDARTHFFQAADGAVAAFHALGV